MPEAPNIVHAVEVAPVAGEGMATGRPLLIPFDAWAVLVGSEQLAHYWSVNNGGKGRTNCGIKADTRWVEAGSWIRCLRCTKIAALTI